MVIITVKGYGDIKIELDYDNAPISAKNFAALVGKGFYNGLSFHRVIRHFMIQGGDPEGTGMGGAGYEIKGEFAQNGVPNRLSHKRGVISMARASDPDSASSQFFICDKDDEFLDGAYAAFGKVVEGMDVVDQIALNRTDGLDKPLVPVIIEKAILVGEK
ncbi:MAG: peptidylprolyl isomerase [Bacilli bacterium]|jgi:peptidyl-prolyl cis-trans isomerase B (cyclophilin B)|nr:peptidylprolyl isomerase [Bacilli bacterium]